MSGFFHGWRQMAGCVLLLMAIALMGMWMRSRINVQGIWFGVRGWRLSITSHAGISWGQTPTDFPVGWWGYVHPSSAILTNSFFIITGDMFFAALVLPLTLVSAYMILRKPRKRELSMAVQCPN